VTGSPGRTGVVTGKVLQIVCPRTFGASSDARDRGLNRHVGKVYGYGPRKLASPEDEGRPIGSGQTAFGEFRDRLGNPQPEPDRRAAVAYCRRLDRRRQCAATPVPIGQITPVPPRPQ
jgi:hypothetical protein